MNALQFKKLKIGDRILTYNGTCTTVTDIDRMAEADLWQRTMEGLPSCAYGC